MARISRSDELARLATKGKAFCPVPATASSAVHSALASLWLPLISPIGSRRPPEVFLMEPTDAWHRHDPAHARRLHTPRLGCVSFAKTPSGAK